MPRVLDHRERKAPRRGKTTGDGPVDIGIVGAPDQRAATRQAVEVARPVARKIEPVRRAIEPQDRAALVLVRPLAGFFGSERGRHTLLGAPPGERGGPAPRHEELAETLRV